MSNNSLGNPFDSKTSLIHSQQCDCTLCVQERLGPVTDRDRQQALSKVIAPPRRPNSMA